VDEEPTGTAGDGLARSLGLPGHVDLGWCLGSTRSSEVWTGRDRRRGRDVVVKVQRGPGVAGRVEVEARATARLAGTAGVIVPVAVGSVGDDVAWLVTDRAVGGPLADRTAASPSELARWVAEVAAALASAHALGVVHGDVTPANVLLDRARDPHRADAHAVLADFGSAALLSDPRPPAGPGGRQPLGHTPAFAAPERRRGGPASPESDVFGLGATFAATAVRLGVELPGGVARALVACGAERPARRPTAAALAARLRPWRGDGAGRGRRR